ncbi:MAG: MerR family transcriptional regulator [Proteobacteria bacterium]|nr:MerR family transcriptional regulator [Pseudomonadota bacterium]
MAKGPNAFRTISEAADELGVPQHVLRFWETKFSFVKPMKRAGGRRFYRPQDVAVLKGVKALLYARGYKIEGVQRLYREEGIKRLLTAGDPDGAMGVSAADFEHEDAGDTAAAAPVGAGERARLKHVLKELEAAKARLDSVLDQA